MKRFKKRSLTAVSEGHDSTSTTWLPDLLEREPGPHFDSNPDVLQPIDVFEEFFDSAMVDNIVVETNRYAQERVTALGDRHPSSRLRKWSDTTRAEVLVFVMLLLAMGTLQQPEMTDHWSSDQWLYETPGFA